MQEAMGLSYPTAKELSESVGLNANRKAIKTLALSTLVPANFLTK
jgi:hypothetical protein